MQITRGVARCSLAEVTPRHVLAMTLATAACSSSPPTTATPPGGAGRDGAGSGSADGDGLDGDAPVLAHGAPLALAWDDLSLFHADGERLAVALDGRVLYEQMKRGPLLRYELSLAGDPLLGEIQRVSARLRAERTRYVLRTGIPDEVLIKIHHTDAAGAIVAHRIWERDLGTLAPGDVLADVRQVVRATANRARAGTGQAIEPAVAGERWPDVFTPAP